MIHISVLECPCKVQVNRFSVNFLCFVRLLIHSKAQVQYKSELNRSQVCIQREHTLKFKIFTKKIFANRFASLDPLCINLIRMAIGCNDYIANSTKSFGHTNFLNFARNKQMKCKCEYRVIWKLLGFCCCCKNSIR